THDNKTVSVTNDDVTGMDQFTADDDGIIDRRQCFLDGALDADAEREHRETEIAKLQRVAHAGIRDKTANTLGKARIGQHVAESPSFFVFTAGNNNDVARISVVDG